MTASGADRGAQRAIHDCSRDLLPVHGNPRVELSTAGVKPGRRAVRCFTGRNAGVFTSDPAIFMPFIFR